MKTKKASQKSIAKDDDLAKHPVSGQIKEWIKRNQLKRDNARRQEIENKMYSRNWYEKSSGQLTKAEYYKQLRGPRQFGWSQTTH